MTKKYEVAVDGDKEEFTRKKDVTETLLDAVSDGGTHKVSVSEVDDKANEEETKTEAEKPKVEGGHLGLGHLR